MFAPAPVRQVINPVVLSFFCSWRAWVRSDSSRGTLVLAFELEGLAVALLLLLVGDTHLDVSNCSVYDLHLETTCPYWAVTVTLFGSYGRDARGLNQRPCR